MGPKNSLVLLLCSCLCSCNWLFGIDPVTVRDGSVLEASADAPAEADAGTCALRRWPARPSSDDPSSGDVPAFHQALVTVDFGVRPKGEQLPTLGFDLDGFCTCDPDPESCRSTVEGGAPAHCDLEGGVDNAIIPLAQYVSAFAGFFDQSFINLRLRAGTYGALLRITGYNGQPNDTQVELAVFPSNGTEGSAMPKYDGNDTWTIDPSSVVGGMVTDGGSPPPKYVDPNAYVVNGVLVANLAFPVALGGGMNENTLTAELVGGVLTATLSPSMGSFKTDDGVIAGRWTTTKVLTSLQVLHDPLDNTKMQYLCGSNGTYQLIKPIICKSADIVSNVLEDGKNAPCSALSVGMAFTASPAKLGSVYGLSDAGAPCGPQWVDSCLK